VRTLMTLEPNAAGNLVPPICDEYMVVDRSRTLWEPPGRRADLAIMLDCGRVAQLGQYKETVEQATHRVIIDQGHVGHDAAELDISDSDAASTMSVVVRLLGRKVLTPAMARNLLFALRCDTDNLPKEEMSASARREVDHLTRIGGITWEEIGALQDRPIQVADWVVAHRALLSSRWYRNVDMHQTGPKARVHLTVATMLPTPGQPPDPRSLGPADQATGPVDQRNWDPFPGRIARAVADLVTPPSQRARGQAARVDPRRARQSAEATVVLVIFGDRFSIRCDNAPADAVGNITAELRDHGVPNCGGRDGSGGGKLPDGSPPGHVPVVTPDQLVDKFRAAMSATFGGHMREYAGPPVHLLPGRGGHALPGTTYNPLAR